MLEIRRRTQQPAQIPVMTTEAPRMPQKALEALQAGEYHPASKDPLKWQQMPFVSVDGKTDYKQVFSEAYKFLRKYSPPEKDPDGMPGGYLWRMGTELIEIAQKYGEGSFMHNLILVIFQELEKQYKFIMDN